MIPSRIGGGKGNFLLEYWIFHIFMVHFERLSHFLRSLLFK